MIQQNLVGRNASLPKHHWIEYRIGVNLGDVIIETDDVYGDGVNIATRLEGIAHPGEVYISGGIYEQIKHKLVCGYESLGDRHVKNITDPVRVYRVLPDPSALHERRKRRERILALLLILALLIIAGGTLWYTLWPASQGDRIRRQLPFHLRRKRRRRLRLPQNNERRRNPRLPWRQLNNRRRLGPSRLRQRNRRRR